MTNSTDLSQETDIALAVTPDTAQPPMYALIMHNDDYTTMEFVVYVLVQVLQLPEELAYLLMLKIHHEGLARVSVLPKEIAEMKARQIQLLAEQEEFPLLVTIEPV